MKLYKYAALACMGLTLATTACVDDLDVKPDDPQTKLELNTTDEWYGYLGSLYGSLLAATGTHRNSPPTTPSS